MNRQRGAALMMGLLMLLVLTLAAVAAVNMSTVNLRIVGNMQASQQAESAVNYQLETALLTPSYYTKGDKDTVYTVAVTGGTVTVNPRVCLYSSGNPPGQENSAGYDPAEYTHWQTSATYTNATTGAQTTYVQVIRKIMSGNDNCN